MAIPAPFLNRFEKYRLTLKHVSASAWSKFHRFSDIVISAKRRVAQIIATFKVGIDLLCWVIDSHTLESIFIDMLPGQDNFAWDDISGFEAGCFPVGIKSTIIVLLEKLTSLRDLENHVDVCIQLAQSVFPVDIVSALENVFHEYNDNGAMIAFFSTNDSTSKFEDNALFIAVYGILQMIITRVAIFRVVQLCSPEAIFINR